MAVHQASKPAACASQYREGLLMVTERSLPPVWEKHRKAKENQIDSRRDWRSLGDLDPIKGGVSWRVRELRADDGLAEAGPETASVDHRRRRLPVRRAAGLALRQRLDASPHSHPLRGRAGSAAKVPRDGGRSGTRAGVGSDHEVG